MSDDDTPKKLSYRLLQGWTMLENHCSTPGCYTPLMEDRRRTKKIECSTCNAEYKRTEHGGVVRLTPQVATTTTTTASTPEQQSSPQPEESSPQFDDLADEWDEEFFQRQREARNAHSSKLGKLLLQQWTMLPEHCHSCAVPLMKSPTDETMLCVSCNHDYNPNSKPSPSIPDSSSSTSTGPSSTSSVQTPSSSSTPPVQTPIQTPLPIQAPSTTTPITPSHPASSASVLSHDVWSRAKSTILFTVQETCAEIEKTPISNIKAKKSLVSLLTQCSLAYQSLENNL